METVEILAGGDFITAVKALDLTSAVCTYRYNPPEGSLRENYQIWLMSEEDFENIDSIDEEDWQDDWGWWRWNTGSSMGSVDRCYLINGKKILAWDGRYRKSFFETECANCDDRTNGRCDASDSSQVQCLHERSYKDLISYICEEIRVSTANNISALTTDLAKQNNMTLSELFTNFLGEGSMDKNEIQIKVRYLTPDIPPLEYIGGKSDWVDLRAAEDVELKAGEFKLIPLGVAMQLPEGYEAHIIPRSSTYKNFGVIQANHMGLIDESYCGDNDQWYFPAIALRDTVIHAGDRICQFRVMEHQPPLEFEPVDSFGNTDRGGLGSTGRR